MKNNHEFSKNFFSKSPSPKEVELTSQSLFFEFFGKKKNFFVPIPETVLLKDGFFNNIIFQI